MKKIYKFLGLAGLVLTPFLGNSQVFVTTDFNAGLPAGWTTSNFALNTSANNCGTQALRSNLWSFATTGNFATATYTATGGQIDISFDYKIVDFASNTPTSGNWGTLTLEHTINGGATWATDTVINQTNHVPANTCATVTTFTTAAEVPMGSSVQYRVSGAWTSGDYDVYFDNMSFVEVVTCPLPSGLTLNAADLTSATFSWTPGGTESEWQMQYGAPGFTPGTGTAILTSNNMMETISGLTSNSFYELYIRAACSPGDTSGYLGPIAFNTFNQGLYMDVNNACGPGFTDISSTGTLNLLGDDGEVGATLPFTLLYQGTPYTNMTIGSNGALVFGTLTAQVGFSNGPIAGQADGLYPWWDDLFTEQSPTDGVYFQALGTAPNQQFIVQWNKPHISGNSSAYIFQAIIDEATGEIFFIYDDVEVANGALDFGGSATIGVAGPSQDIQVSFNNQNYLTNNSCAHFFYTDCPNPTAFSVSYVTPTDAGITWNAGLASETNWTVIYGPAGFDPTLTGTTITTGTNVAILTGLSDITEYDVYIFADCNPGTLQSDGGLVGTFITPPNCSDITGLSASTGVDSLFSAWSWTESSGVGTYPSTSFNVHYGQLGFDLYTGTTVPVDNNFTDTTFDASFLAGGVYQVYVQAVCGTDTSNFVGPVTFTMPLTNDSTCFAEALPVDGNTYIFDNTGATIDANETSIAPPNTGFQTTTGWGNSNVTFTTWFTFDAPASGSVYVSGKDIGFDGQIAIYEATDCGDFTTYTLVAANDDALDFTSAAPYFSVCGLTPGSTYYLMHDSWSTFTTGVYSISLSEIVLEAGASTGLINVCIGDTVNLFDGMAGQDAGGVWNEMTPTASFNDPFFVTNGLAAQVFDFEYVVSEGCAADTSTQQVEIYAPSSAGNDGTITVCQNEPLNLLSGLSGNVDLGGTWYDPSNNPIGSTSITASSLAGLYNYDYITTNGVCPADTANIVVNVSVSCDFLNTDELYFAEMSVYPNPTTGIVNISNFGSTEVFSYEITDVKGSSIAGATSAINGSSSTEIDLGNLETGIYIIEVYNDSARKTFRIVLQ